jgi:TonB family protein
MKRIPVALFAFWTVLSVTPVAVAQETTSRKVVNQVQPSYPTLARSLNLSGTVKIEAVVTSSGSVKSVEIKGGNPVLAEAAAQAVTKWKWEPASHETQEPVELNFKPQ